MITLDACKKILSSMQNKGIDLSDSTLSAVEEFDSPHYHISVVGCFQVGKSTLINRTLLCDDSLLTEGEGLATTAVNTKVVYGDKKLVRVVYKDSNKADVVYEENDINPELLRKLSTASGEDARTALAQSIKYIQIECPCDSLLNYSFIDTPGIDDTNQDLVDLTTIEILPTSDLIVLVVDASKDINQYVKRFLSKSVFQQGLSQVMVMASYKPEFGMSDNNRRLIVDNIKAQLSMIGRLHIPVYAYTYDEQDDGDILAGADIISETLIDFIDQSKQQARIDKLSYYLKNDLLSYAEELNAKLLTNGRSQEEIEELKKKIEAESRKLDKEYVNIKDRFAIHHSALENKINELIDEKFFNESSSNSVISTFLSYFNDCESLDDVRGKIDSAVQRIRPIAEYAFNDVTKYIKNEFQKSLKDISEKTTTAAESIVFSTHVDVFLPIGWTGKINPTLLKCLEVGGTFLLTGGVFYPALVFLAGKVPIIRNFLPHVFLKNKVLKNLRKSLVESINSTKIGLIEEFHSSKEDVVSGIKEVFREIYLIKIQPYQSAVNENESTVLTDEEVNSIESEIKAVYEQVKTLAI